MYVHYINYIIPRCAIFGMLWISLCQRFLLYKWWSVWCIPVLFLRHNSRATETKNITWPMNINQSGWNSEVDWSIEWGMKSPKVPCVATALGADGWWIIIWLTNATNFEKPISKRIGLEEMCLAFEAMGANWSGWSWWYQGYMCHEEGWKQISHWSCVCNCDSAEWKVAKSILTLA